MVVDTALEHGEVDRLFHALADPTRRDIVARTAHGEHSVTALARNYPMSFAAVQKHVAVLERAGLVAKERRGRQVLVRARLDRVQLASRVLDQLETLWRGRLERFDRALAPPESSPCPSPSPSPSRSGADT